MTISIIDGRICDKFIITFNIQNTTITVDHFGVSWPTIQFTISTFDSTLQDGYDRVYCRINNDSDVPATFVRVEFYFPNMTTPDKFRYFPLFNIISIDAFNVSKPS